MEDCSIFNYNKHKFYIDLEYLDSTLNIKKILPYCRLAVLCVLWISLGTECFSQFLAPVVFSRDKVFCLQVYYQCIFLFCFPLCHTFIFSCTSVVWIVIPQRNLWVYTHTHKHTHTLKLAHMLSYLFSSCSQEALMHHFSDSNACCCFALLLSLWFKKKTTLLSAGHSGVKKKSLWFGTFQLLLGRI